jgi:hypothetical protein
LKLRQERRETLKGEVEETSLLFVSLDEGREEEPGGVHDEEDILEEFGDRFELRFVRESQRKNRGKDEEETHHLVPPSAVHEPVLVPQDLQPKFRHRMHPLSLAQLAEVLQEDLAQQRRRSQPRLSHPIRIAAEDLRLQQFFEEGEEDALEDDRQVDVGVGEDFGGEEGTLKGADGVLTEFSGRVEAELGVGGEEGDPAGFPGCCCEEGASVKKGRGRREVRTYLEKGTTSKSR